MIIKKLIISHAIIGIATGSNQSPLVTEDNSVQPFKSLITGQDGCTFLADKENGGVQICSKDDKPYELEVEGFFTKTQGERSGDCLFTFNESDKKAKDQLSVISELITGCKSPFQFKQSCLADYEKFGIWDAMKEPVGFWESLKVVSIDQSGESGITLTCSRGKTVLKYFVPNSSKDPEIKGILTNEKESTNFVKKSFGLDNILVGGSEDLYYIKSKADVACQKLAKARQDLIEILKMSQHCDKNESS